MTSIIETVYESSLKLLVPSSPREMYKTIIDEMVTFTDAEYGHIILSRDDKLVNVYSSDPTLPYIAPRNRGFTYQTFKTGKVHVFDRKTIIAIHPNVNQDAQSFIFVPLIYDKKATGVIILSSRHRSTKVTKQITHGLKLLGSMASLSIRKTQSHYDALKAIKTLELFMAMASHELKTPLTVIKLYVQLLAERYKNESVMEQQWVQKLQKETDRLVRLVNELLQLDASKAKPFKPKKQSCHLRAIVQNAITNSQMSYPNHIYVFRDYLHDNPDVIKGDQDKLLQAFINILNNAAKFSSPNTMIVISLSKSANLLSLKIEDQGKGITEKDLPHVFKSFYKSGFNRNIEGMGLGLAIVKRIITQSHGTIKINSIINKGTTVEVHIPATNNTVITKTL